MMEFLKSKRGLSEKIIDEFDFGYCPRSTNHQLAGRLIMPICDPYGEVVALSTRDFQAPKDRTHWHESFDKSMYLYGYHLAKMDISALDEVVVVEGQFDVTCLHSYNIRNVVGICGSAFNLIQLALLARICSTVYFVMDPDNSGKKTVDRAKDLYKSNYMIYRNMKFHYVDLPENLDPDDFVIKNGAEEFKKLLKESRK